MHGELHHADGDMVPFSVPSGLNFEAAGGSAVLYCLSNYLLRGHWVAVNMTWALFMIKCRNTQKSAHPPLWWTCKVLCPWALFCKTVVMLPVTHEKHAKTSWITFLISFLVLVVVQFTSSYSSPAGKYKSEISYLVKMLICFCLSSLCSYYFVFVLFLCSYYIPLCLYYMLYVCTIVC